MKINMNKLMLTVLLIGSAFSLQAQDSTKVEADGRSGVYWLYYNNYNLAIRYNDFAEAKNALYSLINIEPQNDSLRFNLAYLYYEAKQYPSTILVCMDVLERHPQDAPSLEMTAISYEELGIKDKALANYEKLYMVTESLETLYKLTNIQLELKRYNECTVNVDIILKNPEIDSKKMIFQISEFEQREYPLRVATLNLSGMVKAAQGDKEGARKDFNRALEISPDFIFATNNLADLDK